MHPNPEDSLMGNLETKICICFQFIRIFIINFKTTLALFLYFCKSLKESGYWPNTFFAFFAEDAQTNIIIIWR